MKNLIFVVLSLLVAQISLAQPELDWSRTYGGEYTESASDIVPLPGGGWALAGSMNPDAEDSDMLLMFLDEDFDSLATTILGGDYDEGCQKLLLMPDSGFTLVGYTKSDEDTIRNVLIVRTDNEGEEIWSETFGGDEYDYVHGAAVLNDGTIVLGGSITENRRSYGWLWALDPEDGEVLWEIVNESSHTTNLAITSAGENEFVVVSQQLNVGELSYMIQMTRFDEEGYEVWYLENETRDNFLATDVVQTTDGSFLAVGHTIVGVMSWAWLVDEEGEETWFDYGYGSAEYTVPYSAVDLVGFGYALAGYELVVDDGIVENILLLKLDAEGEQLWYFNPEDDGDQVANKVLLLDDYSYLLVGVNTVYGEETNQDILILKTTIDPDVPDIGQIEFPDTSMLEDDYMVFEMDAVWEYVDVIIDEPSDLDSIWFDGGDYFVCTVEEDELVIESYPDWNGIDSVRVIVRTSYGFLAQFWWEITVEPVYDPLQEFVLDSPPDSTEDFHEDYAFSWHSASNPWEDYDVTYSLHFGMEPFESEFTNYSTSDTIVQNRYNLNLMIDSLDLIYHVSYLPWWIVAENDSGSITSDFRYLFINWGSVNEDGGQVPTEFTLEPVYPNPFNSQATISFSIPSQGMVKLGMFDISGRLVDVLYSGELSAGNYSSQLIADDYPTGTYLLRLETSDNVQVQKVVLLK